MKQVYIAINPTELGKKAIQKVFTSQVKAFKFLDSSNEKLELHRFKLGRD